MKLLRGVALFFVSAVGIVPLPRSASAQIAVLDRTLQQHVARPGQTYAGTIVVTNTTDAPQEAKLYHTDYLFYADGRSLFDEPGTVPRSNARWITINPSFITIAPRSQATVTYEVHVPADADPPLSGSYWSVVMVEAVPPGSAESAKAAEQRPGVAITTRVRYGVQIVTHVEGTGESRLDFAQPRFSVDEAGAAHLEFDILNVGERSSPLDVTVELYDATGQRVAGFEDTVRILHPGTSVRKRFRLGALPAGTYEALVAADTGAEIFGAQYTLRF